MNLQQLQSMGAFAPIDAITQQIEWKGQSFEVGIKRLSFGAAERMRSNGAENFNTRLIAECVLLAGEPLKYEDAFRLDPSLAQQLLIAVNRAHEDTEDPKAPTSGAN